LALTSGTRLGPYEVTEQIGEGGMGQVYRARDTKLNRDVAIKVLPESFANDADRLARFEREAQVLASLNHPNIAHIHGLEESRGVGAIVMELVQGDDLSVLIARGPMPLADALPIAKQIADALEAAHEQGIIHRDLKPANIKIRSDGTVKVLDFGLAKALDPAATSSVEAVNSPTLSVRGTQMGLIIGTAAYMAPEQARGKPVDRRADIWAFGVVLYEMLSGRRAFEGEDISVTLASVIKEDVSWPSLPADLPEPLRRLLRRCLEKDPRRRLRDIGEARLVLEDPASSAPVTSAPAAATVASRDAAPLWQRAMPIIATAVIVGAAASVVAWILWPPLPPATAVVTRFPIVLSDEQVITQQNVSVVAVSPDGARIVYAVNRQLYVRSMGDVEARPIPGTNVNAGSPFFSPDGQWVGFFSYGDSLLRKIAIGGGSPVTLCKVDAPWGATWHGDTIFVASGTHGLMRVSANGGEPEVVVKIGPGEAAEGPQVLDDGRLLLYSLTTGSGVDVGTRRRSSSNRWPRASATSWCVAGARRGIWPRLICRGAAAAILCMRLAIRFSPRRSTPHASSYAGPLCRSSSRSPVLPIQHCRAASRNTPCPPPACSPTCRAGRAALPCPRPSPSLVATARSRRSACLRNRTFTRACRQTAGSSWSAPTMVRTPMCGSTTSSPVARCAGSHSAVAISIRFGRATAASSPSNRIGMATTPSSDNRPMAADRPNA